MNSPAAPSRRLHAILVTLVFVLVAAFVYAPPLLAAGRAEGYGDERDLTESFRRSFEVYWTSGARRFTPDLQRVVDYWFRFHVAKATIAALLLVVLVALGAALWRSLRHTRGLAVAVAAVTSAGLFTVVTVMANIQGAAAPFASLLPMLTDGPPDGQLTATLGEVRQQLSGPRTAPAADVMVSGFGHYHAVMAVVASVTGGVLAAAAVLAWRAYRRGADRRARRALAWFGVLMVVSSFAAFGVAYANVTVAADPAPALLAFVDGSW